MALELPFLKKEDPVKSYFDSKKPDAKPKPKKHAVIEKFMYEISKKKPSELDTGQKLIKFGFYQKTPEGDPVLGDDGLPMPVQEVAEVVQHRSIPTDFPKSERRFAMALEFSSLNVEQIYYYFMKFYKEMCGCEQVYKITDNLSTSVASSLFGNMQARLSAQQNQASQYLKGISEMVKGLFQIVREIRIIDDRLSYYYDSDGTKDEDGKPKGNPSNTKSSEIVLKGFWIDQVEGGSKNPTSVYGMASQVGFTILPDLFFSFTPSSKTKIDEEVDNLKFNRKVKEVLKRKLRQYYEWKEKTKAELEQRRRFEIKYLRQHHDTIRLYVSWIKPYLKNVRRLQLYEKGMNNANIINSFETNLIEIETLFVRGGFGKVNGCISLHIMHRVKPELSYHSYEYQNKGPIHVGRADITVRGYTWDDKQVKAYQEYRNAEEIELLGAIDESIQAALDSLGDELMKYLKEAGGEKFAGSAADDKPSGPEHKGVLEPFLALFGGFRETFGQLLPSKPKKEKPPSQKDRWGKHKDKERAKEFVKDVVWEGVYRYKQAIGATYW